MHNQHLFLRTAASLHRHLIWWVKIALAVTLILPAGLPLQAATQQAEAIEQRVNCTRVAENLLECNPSRDDIGAAAPNESNAIQATTAVQPAGTIVLLGSGNWLSVHNLFLHDTNGNNYTRYEYSTTSTGPWSSVCDEGVPGEVEWRYCSFGGLTAGAIYYLRQTYVDPDGVTGPNPLVLGPIPMPSTTVNAVTLRKSTPIVKDTHILVTTEIYGDANRNSQMIVDAATSSTGPWTQKCGPQTSFSPKLCRVHGLTLDTNYYLKITLSDPDGVTGTTPQVIGPVRYTGVANLALNKTITIDPGWGCCSNPAELLDGRIQNVDWTHGFAWTGGNGGWGGGLSGWKQATIDLGASRSINRVDWWTHDANNVPTTWKIATSRDNVTFTDVYSDTTARCRTATTALVVNWVIPTCSHSARFNAVNARYVRYRFDDRTLLDNIHGWAVELEVFKQKSPTIRVRKYQDSNSDGWRDDGEPWLSGWTFKLYNSSGSVVGTQITNQFGKASFINLPIGRYTACEEQQGGWYNTQPGFHEATYDQPCYTFTVTWNSLATLSFGNSTTPPVVSANSQHGADGMVITFLPDTELNPSQNIEEYDPWLDQPDDMVKAYLPIIQQ